MLKKAVPFPFGSLSPQETCFQVMTENKPRLVILFKNCYSSGEMNLLLVPMWMHWQTALKEYVVTTHLIWIWLF